MDFINQIASFATPYKKPARSSVSVDPLIRMKKSFLKNANKQLAILNGSDNTGDNVVYWFEPCKDGGLTVSLRNGVKYIPINGEKTFNVKDEAEAIQFIEFAIAGVNKGQFDDLLLSTKRTKKVAA